MVAAPAPTPEPLPPPPASPPPSPLPAPAWERRPPAPPRRKGYAHPPTEVPANLVEAAWFARTPLKVQFGKDNQAWAFTLFGTIQADYITDTTRSYNDFIGQSLVARSDTYEGTTGRTQFGMRNTRVGFLLDSPAIGSVTSVGGVPGRLRAAISRAFRTSPRGRRGSAGISETAYYNSPTARIRHAYLTLRNPVVDILAGQTFDVFGWQNFYAPCALLGRSEPAVFTLRAVPVVQELGAGGPVVVDIAFAAARPAQRDSRVPDLEGGLRLSIPG